MRRNTEATKKKQHKLDKRIVAAVAVGVVILVVVIAKFTSRQATAVPVATDPTNVPVLGPALPTAIAVSGADPYPSDPAAQVRWVTRNKKPAMLLYHSTNCIPCKAMEALVAKVRADYEPDVVFVDIITNDPANSTEVRRSGIRYIPTTFFASSSGQSEQVVGAMEEEALRVWLDDLKAGK
jgi:thiol:disulfide interchange protein